MSRKVLILGATSAIAAEVAQLCAARGDRLFLVGRDPTRLDQLASNLEGDLAGSLARDLDDLDGNAAVVAAAIESLGGLDVALIAHGYLGDQILSEAEWGEANRILTTNYLSPVSLLIPLANHFAAQGHGHLAAITSVAGERGRPRNYTYGSAKGGLTRYLEGVRSRLYRTRVRVHNLKLGPVDTPMTEGHSKHALFGEKQKVARGIVAALDRRGHVVYLPRVWGWIMAVVRGLPEPIFQRFGFLAGR